ncbi:WD40 repeat-like protein [Basidiobolus meristosporus CBS 931.73]|uniref:WD40 repeat-like protein n=1 Tax=Basidiobolus meristosporus CBS 931.73 TaxID=1314790 RepID=A0A1Y1XWQ6_9FUNG|nr:WD40 repeat-like protein [Basidiobolus meristosporus CBS 931.73]|eukprot:ORX90158.1 WD40 repeat-like protein [Basidiobolus meristosporus CBS 931.73]
MTGCSVIGSYPSVEIHQVKFAFLSMTAVSKYQAYPPSSNWYTSQVSSYSSSTDLFLYGARSSIILLDAISLEFRGLLYAHSVRVNAIAASKLDRFCISAGGDKKVKCWDLVERTTSSVHELHKSEVQSLAWSTNEDFYVSGDKTGGIIAWNPTTEKYQKGNFQNSAIFCIEASPTHSNVFAVGYQNGSMLILKISTEEEMSVLYRLKGHDDEIHSLSWQTSTWDIANAGRVLTARTGIPILEVTLLPEYKPLASGSRDKSIKVWDVPNERQVFCLKLPKAKGHLTEQQKSRIWTSVMWDPKSQHKLICSSYMGEIIICDTKDERWIKDRFKDGHSRCVFSMVPVRNGQSMITTSMDRQIILWNTESRRPTTLIQGLGGFVYSLDMSELDPTKVAMGLGDNTIRVWNYMDPEKPYDSKLIWKGLKGKITRLKWHPSEEGVLSYGTDAGNFGLIDVYTETIKSFKSYHKSTVYSIDWCKRASLDEAEPSDEWVLLTCGGDGKVLVSETKRPDKPSKNVNEFVEKNNPEWMHTVQDKKQTLPKRSEVALDPLGRFLALGNADGSLEVYHLPSFRLTYRFNGQRQAINRLKWRVHTVPAETLGSPDSIKYWLASGSDDNSVCIHDITATEPTDIPIPQTSSFQLLRGHRKGITDLSWSWSDPYKLASTSFDGSCVVWNVMTGEKLAQFQAECGRAMCTTWSILDPDQIFVGMDEQMVCLWKASEHPFTKKNPDDSSKKIRATMTEPERPSMETAADIPPPSPINIPEDPINKQPPPALASASSTRKKRSNEKKGKTNMFPRSSNAFMSETRKTMQQNCLDLAKKRAHQSVDLDDPVVNKKSTNMVEMLFGERRELLNLLDIEAQALQTNPNTTDLQLPLLVWQGNIEGALTDVLNSDNPSLSHMPLVALSPMAGQDMWKSFLQAYASKLAKSGDYHTAVIFYIGCSCIYEAVKVYLEAELFKEAYILAKLRLSSEDPLITEVLCKWAAQLEQKGLYEQACQCYLAAKLSSDAINAIARRNDLSALRSAADLAEILEDPSTSERLFRYALESHRRGEFSEAVKIYQRCAFEKSSMYLMILGVEKWMLENNPQTNEAIEREGTDDNPTSHELRFVRIVESLWRSYGVDLDSLNTSIDLLQLEKENFDSLRHDHLGQTAFHLTLHIIHLVRGCTEEALNRLAILKENLRLKADQAQIEWVNQIIFDQDIIGIEALEKRLLHPIVES